MSLVIFNPKPEIYEKYILDSNVVFYDGEGWWIVRGNERICTGKYSCIPGGIGDGLQPIHHLIDEIRNFGPLWSRWMARGDQYELLYRDVLFNILEISQGMRAYNVNVALFNTGVTHHISTMVFEIACASANVKQVFLYTNNVMLGRLLPLVQEKSITDRKPLAIEISENNAAENIKRFIENKLSGGTPEAGGGLPKVSEASVFVAVLYVFRLFVKRLFIPVKRILFRSKGKSTLLNQYYDYKPLDFYRLIIQQSFALSFYKRNINKEEIETVKASRKSRLLIAAHFQPEATSFPEGWDAHNNIDIVLELRRRGYKEDILYKEHPATFMYTAEVVDFTRVGVCRSKRYYEQLIELGCKLISPTVELSLNDEDRWYLPVTITGTIAIERSLAGLHTIVTGYPWYKGLPGTLPLVEIESLVEIKEEWMTPDPELARRAFEFLDDMLSNKTMINTMGFGTGQPLTNSEDKKTFLNEFDTLVSSLKKL